MKEDSNENVQILADQIKSLLIIIDGFVEHLTDEDYKLLDKAKLGLKSNIDIRQSAATLALAFGLECDTESEEYKIKTLDAIISLFNVRKCYRKALLDKIVQEQNKQKNRQELMKILGMID